MATEETQKSWEKWEPKLNKHIEDLLWALFAESNTPFFDRGKLSTELIAEFCRDKEVQMLTFEYVQTIRKNWESRFPGKGILIPKKRNEGSTAKVYDIPPLDLPRTLPQSTANEHHPQIPATENTTTNFPENCGSGKPMAPAAPDKPSGSPVAKPAISPTTSADSRNAPGLKPGQVPTQASMPTQIPDAKPTFHLPNCKVGTPYAAKIEGTDKSGRKINVVDLKFPDGLGLTFDSASQMVTGQPLRDGEFDLDLQWSFNDTLAKVSDKCRLASIPDPRSLWKVIEPANDLPYRKPHLDQKLLKGKGFSIAAASRRGRSHEHSGSFRDDDFFISHNHTSGWSVLIVADGAGSAKCSREGSRIAVETAGKHLVENLSGELGSKVAGLLASWEANTDSQKAIGEDFHYFFHKMASNAIEAIEQEAQAQSTSVKEYSTTLLAAAVKKDHAKTFLATFWMGDGAIAAYGPSGTVKLMGSPDGGEFAGQTRFLDRNALVDQGFGKRVRVGLLQDVSSVILMTDGVSDPYFETDNELRDPAKWDVFWDEIEPKLNGENPEQQLVEWLHFFKQGHHDDRTIALLW
ncbi:PP2C family serine/threonine-protein phosphatase [uncultured Deefgea sp.]|uniref:PP2C family serine/threonine-protein phosphatase n=1 Tax=uncultured Deefgea sp. TaxID=1304914 RepID=UPI002595004F|nr:PP2C family serine/threonine-protein phosphatase [uncultured Deefgea sp.]